MKEKIKEIWESKIFKITIIIMLIINTIMLWRVWELYYPQATIVIHDYGKVFENELEWKIWRIENERN